MKKSNSESYVKKKNNVCAQHLLVSRRQAGGESIFVFLHVLMGLAKECAFSDVIADMYREELTRDFINGLASSAVLQRLLGKEELSLNQAFELADNLDRAHRYSSCMGSLVPDQSLPMMTSDSTARNSGAAACTRRSSSSVVKAASFFFCGLDTHRNRSLCPARNVSCHICGKRGHFARVCWSSDFIRACPRDKLPFILQASSYPCPLHSSKSSPMRQTDSLMIFVTFSALVFPVL